MHHSAVRLYKTAFELLSALLLLLLLLMHVKHTGCERCCCGHPASKGNVRRCSSTCTSAAWHRHTAPTSIKAQACEYNPHAEVEYGGPKTSDALQHITRNKGC
jgi:hypothetical protein